MTADSPLRAAERKATGHRNYHCEWTDSNVTVQDTLPPWARKEELKKLAKTQGQDLPFFVYLLLSAITAIVAVWAHRCQCHALSAVVKAF